MKIINVSNRLFTFKVLILLFTILIAGETLSASNRIGDFEGLIKQADVIAIGRYVDVSSSWVKKKIYTTAIFKIEKFIKGDGGAEIAIKVLGGTAIHPRLNAPITMKISNGITFTKGNEAFVFLKKNNDMSYSIVGLSKGNIPVLLDGENMRYMGGGISRISAKKDPDGSSIRIQSAKMELDNFVEYIKGLVQQSK